MCLKERVLHALTKGIELPTFRSERLWSDSIRWMPAQLLVSLIMEAWLGVR